MITIDHTITTQLWDDRYFWECVPWAAAYREPAEELLAQVDAEQSTLSLMHDPLYNQWHAELERRAREDAASLEPLIDFIQLRRHRNETIRLRTRDGFIILWDGDKR